MSALASLTAEELVIGGYPAPQGSRAEFGAVRLGYHEDGRLEVVRER
jgi:hypothetical protein